MADKLTKRTHPLYKNVKSGECVSSGYSGEYLTAPDHGDGATYTLYQEVWVGTNTHAGWTWVKEKGENVK